MTVPSRPQMAVMAPVVMPAAATVYPAKRTKKVGRKVEMPPTVKVHMAMPRVAVQKAGLCAKPSMVVRSSVGLSSSAAPRSGSLMKDQKGVCDEHAGQSGDEEGQAPAVMLSEYAAQQITQRGSYGNGDVEDTED